MTSHNTRAGKPATSKDDDKAGHKLDPRAELGLKKPTPESSEQGDDLDARLNEPYGPGQYRSGIDEPGEPTKKNPGHNNPRHNTPGHDRHDKPVGEETPAATSPGQDQTASYPGLKGPKARELAQNSKPPTEPPSEKHPETIPSPDKDAGRI